MMKPKKIAILGATGHISKGLISNFCESLQNYELFLFARSLQPLRIFLKCVSYEYNDKIHLKKMDEFNNGKYDVIINCVGAGTPSKVKALGGDILRLTETFDNLILDYLLSNNNTLYINFSSGAAYGKDFGSPISESSLVNIEVNNLGAQDYYTISKINSEAKHRSMVNFNIVDLRVFNYFSRFIDMNSKYLITEVLNCIKNNTEFITNSNDIIRDYVHPTDLFKLVEKCVLKHSINDVFDVYSLKPVTKFEILECLKDKYNLKYAINDNLDFINATGFKKNYFSINKKAEKIGYAPIFTSLECIIYESEKILKEI
ncbi:MAG: NAD(P)-dependent oxidoreductase [Candidatus Thermoplasmatota archaeon]|nr:NAD(P)-dependent oxidoreductase [Candidatus Thermoplasmatota archaeon]